MIGFILRRLLSGIVVLFGVVLLVFVLGRVVPGDPCVAAYGEKATPQLCAAFSDRYGLDEPIPVQLAIYFGVLNREGSLISEAGGLNLRRPSWAAARTGSCTATSTIRSASTGRCSISSPSGCQ